MLAPPQVSMPPASAGRQSSSHKSSTSRSSHGMPANTSPASSSNNVLLRARDLLAQGLYSSAELLLAYLLSTLAPPTSFTSSSSSSATAKHNWLYCQTAAYLADACAHSGQDQRALRLYDTAFHACPNTPRLGEEDRVFLFSIKEKQAECHRKLGMHIEAIAAMERIEPGYRTVKASLALAGWYEEAGRPNHAREAYFNVLLKEPLAIEAMMGAIRNGLEFDQIANYFPRETFGQWMAQFVWCYFAARRHRYSEALTGLGELHRQTPLNTDVMLAMADCHYKTGDHLKAHYQYRQIMKRDPDTIKQMDRYAFLLKMRGQRDMLDRHAATISKRHPNQPETLLVTAAAKQMEGDLATALRYVDAAVSQNLRYAESWLMKGSLLLASGRLRDAIVAYRTALVHEETMQCYEGLVECYLLESRVEEAREQAKHVATKMSQLPKARILVGAVLKARGDPSSRRRARVAFEEAYRMNPQCTEAVLTLVTAMEDDQEWDRAIEILKEHTGYIQMATLHSRLAEIHVRLRQYADAMEQYNTALRIDSRYEPAVKGIKRLQRILGSASGDGHELGESDEEEIEDGDIDELSNGGHDEY
ncbi:Anaphase promoting complex subunit 7 [Geranomyces variabilis]|nr:Anaphase promoting complex subunit 7 [Geranomyces variabilis]